MRPVCWCAEQRECFREREYFCGCLRRGVWFFVVSDQRGDAFWDSAGAWGTALAGVSGGNLLTVFLMEYGIRGIGAALACFFP